jgi:hypothetical protein
VGDLSSSFEFYEGLRALVGGAFVVGLYAAICKTFDLDTAVPGNATVAGLLAALAVGFVLLFLDLPGKAAVYQYNTPIEHVAKWNHLAPRAGASAKNIYYEILDVEVPAGIKTKVHYFGVLYKLGFELIYLAAASVPVLVVLAVFKSVTTAQTTTTRPVRAALIVALALHATIVAAALYSRRRSLSRDFSAEITDIDVLLLYSGLASLLLYLLQGMEWAGIVSVAVPWALWAYRYFDGVRRDGTRRNLHASTAALIYGVAACSLCAVGLRAVGKTKTLTGPATLGWLGASLVAAALIAARDHEKRLLGVYATQRTWLDGHRDRLLAKGYFVRVP